MLFGQMASAVNIVHAVDLGRSTCLELYKCRQQLSAEFSACYCALEVPVQLVVLHVGTLLGTLQSLWGHAATALPATQLPSTCALAHQA